MLNENKNSNDYEALNKSKTFCLYPFTHVNFKVDGRTAPCFRSQPIGDGFSTDSGWNSEKWTNLRKDLVNGKRNHICNNCWKLEDSGIESYRKSSLKDVPPFINWRSCLSSYNSDSGEMSEGPKQIELRFSNECNFQCRMCGPLYSSKWERQLDQSLDLAKVVKETTGLKYLRRQLKDVGDKDSKYNANLLKAIEKWADSLEYIMIAGGEPLMQKQHLEALHILKPVSKNITLEYSTNLSLLKAHGEDMISHWKEFKSLVLKVSVDGDPLTYSYIRRFGDLNKLRTNVERIHLELNQNLKRFLGTLTVSIYNVSRVPESVELITELGLLFHSSQVQQPLTLSSQVLPLDEKKRVSERLENYLLNIDENLSLIFKRHSVWENADMRKEQKRNIKKYIRQIIDFMNYQDHSHMFDNFIRYDHALSQGQNSSILEIYPHWRSYVAKN